MITVSRLEDTGNEWCRNGKNMESLKSPSNNCVTIVHRKNYGLPSYWLSLLFRLNNSGRILFWSRDQSEFKTFCKMTDAYSFVRGETLDLFLDMFDESELDHLFEQEIDNMRREVITYRYALICFIRLLWFYRFLAEYFQSFLFWTNIKFSIINSDWQIAFIWSSLPNSRQHSANADVIAHVKSKIIVLRRHFFPDVIFSTTSKVQNYQNKIAEKFLYPSKYVLATYFKKF